MKICTYGDSITQFGGWQRRVQERHLFGGHYLQGLSGSTISNAEVDKWWVSSVTGFPYGSEHDYQTAPQADAILISGYFCANARVNTIPLDTDVILVMGGTNDMAKGIVMGDTVYNNGYNEATFKGALASTIRKIKTRIPNVKVIVLTPIFNATMDIRPYVVAIKEVCDEYGIPVIDVHGKSGINTITSSRLLQPDGTHPTYNVQYSGADAISSVVISELKTYLPIPKDIVY